MLVPPGSFLMGSDTGTYDEKPVRRVAITEPFYLGKFPITQEQYLAVMKSNPATFSRSGRREDFVRSLSDVEVKRLPVETVSWEDAKKFCAAVGGGCRLPTEAEWEYACRAGTHTVFPFGDTLDSTQANCNGNFPNSPYLGRTSPVGDYPANGFGLFDMVGNVWEWCEDWYGAYKDVKAKSDPDGALTDPVQSKNQLYDRRVLRGGSWRLDARGCRSAGRDGLAAVGRSFVGFRACFRLD